MCSGEGRARVPGARPLRCVRARTQRDAHTSTCTLPHCGRRCDRNESTRAADGPGGTAACYRITMTEVPFRPTAFVSCLGCIVALGCGGATPQPAAPEPHHSEASAARPAASESKEAAAQQPTTDST